MLRLYDTLQKKVVDFIPRTAGEVSIYACGPTVYDVPHLGHARTAITYDVLTRYLEWRGLKVTLIVNITDIDDKIIERAKEEGQSETEIAERYLGIYLRQMSQLNIRPPDFQPRATQYIPQMQQFILNLLHSKNAYHINGLGIYFDVTASGEYGSLVGRSAASLLESGQGRIEADDRKKNQLDFALWKNAKEDEPSWEWPGEKYLPAGRPGWHIECVAMSLGELGDGFDIHGGGTDLIFPHHENERAEALASGNDFAKYWMHSGMLNISGEKMAKSESNFITLEEQLSETESQAFRLAMLQTHYRSEMEITSETFRAAGSGLQRIMDFVRGAAIRKISPSAAPRESDQEKFMEAMDNDLATPAALSLIFDLVSEGNAALREVLQHSSKKGHPKSEQSEVVSKCLSAIREFSLALGFELEIPAEPIDVSRLELGEEIRQIINERRLARESEDFQKSDELRDFLYSLGYSVQDAPEGSYYFKNPS